MRSEPLELPALIDRFSRLGPADRKAVRARLSPEERAALERECAETVRPRADVSPEAHRQFRGYSPWLAKLIERSAADDAEQSPFSDACRAAISGAHVSTAEDHREETSLRRTLVRFGLLVGKNTPQEAMQC